MIRGEASTCRIVTTGRRTGATHEVTVWFALLDGVVVAASRHGLAGDWLRNAAADPAVRVAQGRESWPGTAHLVVDADEAAGALEAMAEKYAKHASIVRAWRADPPTFVAVRLDG